MIKCLCVGQDSWLHSDILAVVPGLRHPRSVYLDSTLILLLVLALDMSKQSAKTISGTSCGHFKFVRPCCKRDASILFLLPPRATNIVCVLNKLSVGLLEVLQRGISVMSGLWRGSPDLPPRVRLGRRRPIALHFESLNCDFHLIITMPRAYERRCHSDVDEDATLTGRESATSVPATITLGNSF